MTRVTRAVPAACSGAAALAVRCLAAWVALGLALGAVGCLQPPSTESWGDSLPDRARSRALEDLPEEARRALLPLSEIFYARIVSRRFNSRATFEDPSVRQFFPGLSAYSDYYAALVDALERANVQYARPHRVELIGVERGEGDRVRLQLRFVGGNDLPLRWWNATLERWDEWEWRDGRWWVVPVKV